MDNKEWIIVVGYSFLDIYKAQQRSRRAFDENQGETSVEIATQRERGTKGKGKKCEK
jgi:hypothetical protein